MLRLITAILRSRNRDGRDITARVGGIVAAEVIVGVVADLMLNGIACGIGEDHLPGLAGVARPPQGGIAGIDDLGIRRIERHDINPAAQIEHPPRLTVVPCDVTAGHIAVLDNELRIKGADRRGNRRTAAARTDHAPMFRPGFL